jgi:hypothetical protein
MISAVAGRVFDGASLPADQSGIQLVPADSVAPGDQTPLLALLATFPEADRHSLSQRSEKFLWRAAMVCEIRRSLNRG